MRESRIALTSGFVASIAFSPKLLSANAAVVWTRLIRSESAIMKRGMTSSAFSVARARKLMALMRTPREESSRSGEMASTNGSLCSEIRLSAWTAFSRKISSLKWTVLSNILQRSQ